MRVFFVFIHIPMPEYNLIMDIEWTVDRMNMNSGRCFITGLQMIDCTVVGGK